jgi:hypothetical protein
MSTAKSTPPASSCATLGALDLDDVEAHAARSREAARDRRRDGRGRNVARPWRR